MEAQKVIENLKEIIKSVEKLPKEKNITLWVCLNTNASECDITHIS